MTLKGDGKHHITFWSSDKNSTKERFMFPRGRKGSVLFHRLTPITGARPMAGGGEETYKHTLTWNQKWGTDSFEVASEAKSFG